jgi:hypothetical protein
MLEQSTLPNNPKFKEIKNIIHIDEKWFNGTRKNKTMYMHPDDHTGQCKTRMPFTKSCFILELHNLDLMLKVDVILMAS